MSSASKGAYRENRVKRGLVADGYYVCRAAGSKGTVDLIALKPAEILVIGVKSGELWRTGPVEWNAIWELAVRLDATGVVVQCRDRQPDAWWRQTGPKTGVKGVASPCVPFVLDEVDAAAGAA